MRYPGGVGLKIHAVFYFPPRFCAALAPPFFTSAGQQLAQASELFIDGRVVVHTSTPKYQERDADQRRIVEARSMPSSLRDAAI